MVLLCLQYTGYCHMVFTITQSSLPFPFFLPFPLLLAPASTYTSYSLFVYLSTLQFLLLCPLLFSLCSPCITSPFPLPLFSPLPIPFTVPPPLSSPPPFTPPPPLLPLVPSLPARLDLSGSSTGDDLSLLPFCKEPAPPSEREELSLDP